ncbi:MAG: 50S ribosomal protein L29 [Candidatus Saccharimonadales bacterium]
MATKSKKSEAPVVSSESDLQTKLAELRRDLSDHTRSLAANELPNPRVITKARRDIARTLTAINAQKKEKS